MELGPVYILILAIAGMFTAALTIIKIFSMKRSPGGSAGCTLHGQIESTMKLLGQKVSRKRDVALCDERYENVQRDLAKGHEEFKEIHNCLQEHGEILGRLDERVQFLAEENGFSKRKK